MDVQTGTPYRKLHDRAHGYSLVRTATVRLCAIPRGIQVVLSNNCDTCVVQHQLIVPTRYGGLGAQHTYLMWNVNQPYYTQLIDLNPRYGVLSRDDDSMGSLPGIDDTLLYQLTDDFSDIEVTRIADRRFMVTQALMGADGVMVEKLEVKLPEKSGVIYEHPPAGWLG